MKGVSEKFKHYGLVCRICGFKNLKILHIGNRYNSMAIFKTSIDRVGWAEGRTLGIENNRRYRKYKESADTARLGNPISELILDVFSHLDPTYHQ
jgi:hypothetical protein